MPIFFWENKNILLYPNTWALTSDTVRKIKMKKKRKKRKIKPNERASAWKANKREKTDSVFFVMTHNEWTSCTKLTCKHVHVGLRYKCVCEWERERGGRVVLQKEYEESVCRYENGKSILRLFPLHLFHFKQCETELSLYCQRLPAISYLAYLCMCYI